MYSLAAVDAADERRSAVTAVLTAARAAAPRARRPAPHLTGYLGERTHARQAGQKRAVNISARRAGRGMSFEKK
jgi:hypothetical protein